MQAEPERPRLYDELADWWPLLSPPEEYEEEAAFYRGVLTGAASRPVSEVLELGSGGGNNAWHLKSHFAMTLADCAPGMLEVSRALNPECVHVEGDMRTLRLGRTFDAVFVHDAVCHLTSPEDLRQAMTTAAAHLEPGGVVLFALDYVRETFRPGVESGGHDGVDRGLRYLGWTWDPDAEDTLYTVDYAFLLREADGSVRVEHDRHVEGVFPRRVWLELLSDAGFDAGRVPIVHAELAPEERDVFVGKRR